MHADKHYSYKYCSAAPSKYETVEEEIELRNCMKHIINQRYPVKRFDASQIIPVPHYETTTLAASLQPYKYQRDNRKITKGHLNKTILQPKHTRHEVKNEFDEYIASQLYPYWQRDPKYTRRLVYKLQPNPKKSHEEKPKP